MSRPLKDHIWIWGHPENCLLEATGRESHVTPVGGVKYMDAANLFLNEYGDIHYDMKVENELAREVKRVGWCIDFAATNPENVSKVVEYAKEYRNIKIGMFDDFFSPTNPDNNYTNYTPEMLAAYRKQLHDVGVEMWAVVYTQNFDQLDKATLLRFMQEFDGLSLWFWEEELIAAKYEEFVSYFLELSEGKKRMIGCYVYNFAENTAASPDIVLYQLEQERRMLLDGTIHGIIIHTNAVFGMEPPYEAVEVCKKWMDAHKEEEIEGE